MYEMHGRSANSCCWPEAAQTLHWIHVNANSDNHSTSRCAHVVARLENERVGVIDYDNEVDWQALGQRPVINPQPGQHEHLHVEYEAALYGLSCRGQTFLRVSHSNIIAQHRHAAAMFHESTLYHRT